MKTLTVNSKAVAESMAQDNSASKVTLLFLESAKLSDRLSTSLSYVIVSIIDYLETIDKQRKTKAGSISVLVGNFQAKHPRRLY